VSDETPAPPRKKCTALERRHRVGLLQEAIANGEGPFPAARRLCKSWGISPRRSAARYARLAFRAWEADRPRSGDYLGCAIARRELVFRLALASGDFSTALRATVAADELLGVGERSDGDRDRALAQVVADLLDVVRSGSTDTGTLLRIVGRLETALSGKPMPIAPLDLNLTALDDDARQKLRAVATSLLERRAGDSSTRNASANGTAS